MKETEESTSQNSGKKLLWILGLMGAGFLGICLALVMGAGSFYFFRIMPEETYDSISNARWEQSNVGLMNFKSPRDFLAAERSLKSLLSSPENTKNPIPRFLLAELYNTMNRRPEAISQYRDTIRLAGGSWYNRNIYRRFLDDAHGSLAILYYEDNNREVARQELAAMDDINGNQRSDLLTAMKDSLDEPERADFHLLLGKEFKHELRLAAAKAEFQQATMLSRDPQLKMNASNYMQTQLPQHIQDLSPMARYYNLAGESHQSGDEDLLEAAHDYERAIKETPDFEAGYNALAMIYRQLKDYKKAESAARSAIALNPNYYNSWLTLGDVQLDSDQFEAAIGSFNTALQVISRLPDEDNQHLRANIENQLGYACENLKRLDEAKAHYQQAMTATRDASDDDEDASEDYDYAQDGIKRISESQQAKQASRDKSKISSAKS